MSFIQVYISICDWCKKEVITYTSNEKQRKNSNTMFPLPTDEVPPNETKYWYNFYNDIYGNNWEFCSWECVKCYAHQRIATGKNRLEDDLET